jgi:hypothetical protein
MSSSWPFKDPDEILDYDIDWTNRLYSKAELDQVALGQTVVPADTISTSAWTLDSGDVVIGATSHTTTATKTWLSAGTLASGVSVLTNRIVTAGGRTMDLTVKVKIKAK